MIDKPYIDDTIFAQIMDIRKSGETNMFDVKAVFELAIRKGYDDWLILFSALPRITAILFSQVNANEPLNCNCPQMGAVALLLRKYQAARLV